MTEEAKRLQPQIAVEPPLAASEHRYPTVDRPVPRVTIHAFCESRESSDAIRAAAADRRLSKAHVSVNQGGLIGAAQHYSQAPTPNLLIVEDLSPPSEIFGHLTPLAEVCDPGTKVIIVGKANDVTFYRDLMRQGINEYLVGPLSAAQVIDAIATLYVDPAAPPIGRTFAFLGARGGTGSSTIAHNVGWYIADELNEDVTIVDFDLNFGTAGLDFNQDPVQGVADALTSPERLDDVMLERLLVKCTDHLNLFTAPGVVDRDFDLDATACERVIDVVRQSVPCVIMDIPHVWQPWTRHLVYTADEVVLTATPDLSSLRNAKNMLDLVRAARPNDAPPRIVVNQAGVAKRPEIPAKDFAEAIGIEPSLVLAFEPHIFGTAANNGQMIGELAAQSRAAEGLRNLARLLTGREAPPPKATGLKAVLTQLKAKFDGA
jgi:pilus assembly protein CpaE